MRPTNNPITLIDAQGGKLVTTHEGEIDIPELPPEARRAHVCPDLAHSLLVSIKQLVDAGCKVEYDIVEVRVKYRGKVVWRGGREKSSGLWILPMSPEDPAQLKLSEPKWIDAVNTLGMNATRLLSRPREQANNAFATTTKADLIKYLHQAAFSPVKQTFLKAIKNGQFATWPGLTEEAVKKYLPESSPATDKGHMKRQQKNIRSTTKEENGKRAAAELNSKETAEDMHPKLEHDAFNQLFAYTIQMDAKDGTTYMDCTGRFPIRSLNGMVTIFVL